MKKGNSNLVVMIADEDEPTREFAANVLESHGFTVIQAINGGAAIKVMEEWDIDVAIIAHRMRPNDGFEVAKHALIKGYDPGFVMLTDDPSTDLLLQAGQFGIGQVMRKPIEPGRLVETVRRMIRARGKNPDAIGADKITTYTPEDLMKRAIALASQNARSKMGGPFGAVVADKDGHLLGEGVNSVRVRCDPTAHAEVLAIRRATEKMGTPRLDGCIICCSSEPTMLGEALIISTGIAKVYYGISHEEAGTPRIEEKGIMGEIAKPVSQRTVPHQQVQREQAMEVFNAWHNGGASKT